MAVHILVILPAAKVLRPKNEKPPTAERKTAVLHYRLKNTAIFWFDRFRQKSTNSRYRQKVSPTLNTAKRVPPTLDNTQKVPPTLDTAQKIPPTLYIAPKVPPTLVIDQKVSPMLDTAQKVPAFLFVFVLCSLFFLVLSGSFSVEPFCGRENRETLRHLPIHLPTPRSAWSSRTMSGLEGNPSATSSGLACLLYTSPSPRDKRQSRMPSSA